MTRAGSHDIRKLQEKASCVAYLPEETVLCESRVLSMLYCRENQHFIKISSA